MKSVLLLSFFLVFMCNGHTDIWDSFVANRYKPEAKACNRYRDFETNASEQVKELYRLNHAQQTLRFVIDQKQKYCPLQKGYMSIWEAFDCIQEVIDQSDVDIQLPQIYHAFQTAEALRKDGQPRWLIITGFIHDLGKLLTAFGEPQWAVVGDTFPVGCPFDNKIVFHDYFAQNPDMGSVFFQTKYGVYQPHCGLRNVHMSWGHDEYLYWVVKDYLPETASYIIRFHSFYPHHKEGAYQHLLDPYDHAMLPWLQLFSSYDLYSKDDTPLDINALMPYYQELVAEFFPEKLAW